MSGRYGDSQGYLYGIREHNVTDSVHKNPFDPNDITVVSTGEGEIVPMNKGWNYTTTGKLTFKPLTTLKINSNDEVAVIEIGKV